MDKRGLARAGVAQQDKAVDLRVGDRLQERRALAALTLGQPFQQDTLLLLLPFSRGGQHVQIDIDVGQGQGRLGARLEKARVDYAQRQAAALGREGA